MRKGKVRKSAAWLMIAMLTTCVLTSAVFSGENPWDSDQRPNQSTTPGGGSDTTVVSTVDAGRTVTAGGSAASSSYDTGWTGVVNQVVFFVARHFGDWLRPASRTSSTHSGRW